MAQAETVCGSNCADLKGKPTSMSGNLLPMKCTGHDVIRVVRLLEEGGVPVWLDGGWGIDALLKKETRRHRDMDLIVSLDDLASAETTLAEAGFSRDNRETNLPTRLVLRNCEGLEIDIHPVTFRPDGSAVHIHTEGGGGLKYVYIYAPGGLSGVGMIEGRIVRCTTAAEQIRQKVERRFSPWSESRIREGISADLQDFCSLLQVFGVESGLAQPGELQVVGPEGNGLMDAAEHFRLTHLASLNEQHSRLTTEHAELRARHGDLCAQLAELGADHVRLTAQHADLMAQLRAIRASTSWQLTAPMRWAVTWLEMHLARLRTQ